MRDIGSLKTIVGIPGRRWVTFWASHPLAGRRKSNLSGILREGALAVVIQHDDSRCVSQVLTHKGLVWIYTGDMQ
jgi:hypothetical protein